MLRIIPSILFIFIIANLVNAEEVSQLAAHKSKNQINLIVIDPGFGGKNAGPSGCDGQALAKNINLQIAKKVAEKVKTKLGINVIKTREDDIDISSEERCTVANIHEADLLISIHTNGFEQPSVSGIETFYLNIMPEPGSIRVAAMENGANPKKVVMMEAILKDLLQNSRSQDSEYLAKNVQKYLYEQLKKSHITVRDRGIKQAPFYVLLGSQMPAIMIQIGFITNLDECKFLRSDVYQESISIGIVDGISAFIESRHTQQDSKADGM